MTTFANIVINDGAGTPVAHTFAPVRIDSKGVAWHSDRSGGIALGYPTISFSVKEPTKASRNYRAFAKIVTPVLEVTSPSTATGIQPAPTLAYNLTANLEFIMHERSSLQERKNLNAFAKNFLNLALWTSAVENYEPEA